MKKIVIIADLGHFKAYKLIEGPQASPRLEQISGIDNINAHEKMSEKVSDGAGMFSGGGGNKGTVQGYGEPHQIGTEEERRSIKRIAQAISELIKAESCEHWYLAASKAINKHIVEALDPDIKALLVKNIASDLTTIPNSELLAHFA